MKHFLILTLLSFLAACHFGRDKDDLSGISSLPSFNIQLLDSTTLFNSRQISTGSPIVVVYFRPDCPHCQQETKDFIAHMNALKDFKIYLLTGAELNEIREFVRNFHLEHYQNVTVGKDHNHSFKSIFKPSSIPYLAIYDKDKQLIRIYDQEVPVEMLLKTARG